MLRLAFSTWRLHIVNKFHSYFSLMRFRDLKLHSTLMSSINFDKGGDRNRSPSSTYSTFLHFPSWIKMSSLSYHKIFNISKYFTKLSLIFFESFCFVNMNLFFVNKWIIKTYLMFNRGISFHSFLKMNFLTFFHILFAEKINSREKSVLRGKDNIENTTFHPLICKF